MPYLSIVTFYGICFGFICISFSFGIISAYEFQQSVATAPDESSLILSHSIIPVFVLLSPTTKSMYSEDFLSTPIQIHR